MLSGADNDVLRRIRHDQRCRPAGGIYPPALEAEGLVMAIGQQVRSAALPVSISGEGCGRFSREVEAAVYFSVLAVQISVAD